MYIIKNALRCIGRSKGRNVLIGIIALVIAVSACIGLSIRQAAENAKEFTLEGLSITATISYDRSSMMNGITGGGRPDMNGGGFDRDQFKDMMGKASSLSLEEYEKFAKAESVEDFYYTVTAAFNGNDDLLPVTDEDEEDESESNNGPGGFPGISGDMGFGGGKGMFSSSDFSVIGYSSDSSMTAFVDGTASIEDGGVMFEEGTSENNCVISKELALFNNLAVGDTIVLTNPSSESETYELKIVGLYTSSSNNDFSMSMFGKSQDPANQIYMSATALQAILDASDKVSTTVTDENSGGERDSAVTGDISATYVFENTEKFEAFEPEVRELGLDESYTVSSPDITAFENSLAPLNTLSSIASWVLIFILIIGAIILVVLNIFNVRERKYEVGVLTAMGMKKWKVAAQFMCEILVVTMIAVIIGAGIGAVSSVPVTNTLLAGQIESQNSRQNQVDQNFGRPGNFPGMQGGEFSEPPSDIGGGKNPFESMFNSAENYISEVNSAMNLTVVFQMLGVGLLLTLVASMASVSFIMRYDPLKILANRD